MNNDRLCRGRYASLFHTSFGYGGIVAGEEGVLEVLLPFDRSADNSAAEEIAHRYRLKPEGNWLTITGGNLLERYFAGEAVCFDIPIDTHGFTLFQQTIYQLVRRIPYGSVSSYSEIAAAAGRPGAARGVGSAMARNPVPLIIPCHRVLGKSGALTGYTAPGGIASKSFLLHLENGCKVDNG